MVVKEPDETPWFAATELGSDEMNESYLVENADESFRENDDSKDRQKDTAELE